MRGPEVMALTHRWWRWSVLVVGATTVAAALVGFLWLPSAQGDFRAESLWASICRAAGVPQPRWTDAPPASGSREGTTRVVLSATAAQKAPGDAAGHGATLALQRCSMCHGARGVSQANAPHLAGQYPEVIEKQLADYRHGDRSNSLMQAVAGTLSDADVVSLAAYYSALPPPAARSDGGERAALPLLVQTGDPMRNIAPCSSCHGGIGRKLGAPWLEGLPKDYLAGQIAAFTSGTRHNDSHAQMRNMARRLSTVEVEQLASFYAGR